MSRLAACLIRWTTCLLLAASLQAIAGGMTIDPTASSGSDGSGSDGSSSGGYAQGSATGSLYNAALGTGIVADPYAPTFAQISGINGYQTALGFGTGTSVSGDPVSRPPVRNTFPTSAAPNFLPV